MITIDQQIAWLKQQIKHMESTMPHAVEAGRIAEEHMTHRIACARAILGTLTQLRGIVQGKAVA